MNYQLDKFLNCEKCNTGIELDENERLNGFYICPNCNYNSSDSKEKKEVDKIFYRKYTSQIVFLLTIISMISIALLSHYKQSNVIIILLSVAIIAIIINDRAMPYLVFAKETLKIYKAGFLPPTIINYKSIADVTKEVNSDYLIKLITGKEIILDFDQIKEVERKEFCDKIETLNQFHT